MPIARFGVLATLALTLMLSACSTNDDLAGTTDLEPQFGTRGYDEVSAVAYGKAKKLYVAGALADDGYLRRYDGLGNLIWEHYLDPGSPYNLYNSQNYSVSDVAVDNSGNAWIAWSGSFYDENTEDGYGASYLTKYDLNGNRKAQVKVTDITELAVDSTGNVYALSGYYGAESVVKYMATGVRSWLKSLPGSQSLAVTSSNSVYVVRDSGFVSKFNTSGSQLWAKKLVRGKNDVTVSDDECWSGPDYCHASVTYAITGGLADELNIVGGRTWGVGDGDSCGDTTQDITFERFDKNGKRLASKIYPELYSSFCYFYDDADNSGTTMFDVTSDTLSNTYISTGRQDNGSITKISRTGGQVWTKGFGTSAKEAAVTVATYDGSEVFMGGYTYGYFIHRPLGNGDAFLREVNSSGNLVWAR